MAYKKTDWQDTLRDAQGNLIQKGTPLNAQALGKIEDGIVQAEQKIDTEITKVAQQLAQKADKGEIRYRTEKIGQNDLTTELLSSITGGTPINLQTIPQNNSVEPVKTTFMRQGKNLFDKDSVIAGYLISPTGDLAVSTSQSATPFMTIKPSQRYVTNYNNGFRVGFYDSNKVFISRLDLTTLGNTFTTPENAAFVRISIGNGFIPNLQVEEGTTVTPKEDYFVEMPKLKLSNLQLDATQKYVRPLFESKISNEFKRFLSNGKNLINLATMTGGYRVISNTGELVVDANYKVSPYIEIKSQASYTISSNAPTIVFYDENGKYISGLASGGATTFTTPLNAKYLRLSLVVGQVTFQLEEGTAQTKVESYVLQSDYLKLREGNFQEKTIPVSAIKDPENLVTAVKYPNPPRVTTERYREQNNTQAVSFIDRNNDIWATRWDNTIRKSSDGRSFTTIFDAKPFLNEGEIISLHALYISDTGRIIVCTNQGRTLVSDEAKTTLTEAFKFKAGYSYVNRGHCKYNEFILFSSYGTKTSANPPREVYLSKDHGATWELIFDKPIAQMKDSNDYHIHDVAFDPYSNMIIISIGDGANRQMHYTYDFGKTWFDVFDESVYGVGNWAPAHPISIVVFPEGIAFGSDELPEGVYWWNRPKGIINPPIKWSDFVYKIKFGKETDTLIGTYAGKGYGLQTDNAYYGVMPFRNHNTVTEGHPRLFATADGGRSWHEIFKETVWSTDYMGFLNTLLREENGKIMIYASYSQMGGVYIMKAEMPTFQSF